MCWRTYFSWIQAQGRKRWKEEYIIIYAHARERKQRKAERKYGDTEGHCMTPGSWHVWHPGLGMFDIRVSVCTTPGCRTQEKGLREKWHRKETIQKHATKRKTERKTAEERIQKNNDTVKGQKTQKKGERRQAVRKTRSKPQPDKPVKGRRTLY